MGFSRQEYSSGLPFPSTGDFPNPGTEPRSPILQVDSLPSEPPGKPRGLLSQPQIILAFPSGAFSSGPASFPFVTLRHSYGHQHFCHAPIFQAIVLEWIAISFSRGFSQPRDWTQVYRIVDRRFTIWATREWNVQPEKVWGYDLVSIQVYMKRSCTENGDQLFSISNEGKIKGNRQIEAQDFS